MPLRAPAPRLSPGFRRRKGGLWAAREGQATVEFMLMMALLLLTVLATISLAFLCADLLLTRYASFVAARSYLAQADWRAAGREAAKLVINRAGQAEVEERSGQGVNLKVEIREFFPLRTMFGGAERTTLERETLLGREPDFSGDNTTNW